jgi:hypothetical protein
LPAAGALPKPEAGEFVQTSSIIATSRSSYVARSTIGCPILARGEWPMRIDKGEATADELLDMMRPFSTALMHAYPVDRRVGNVRANDLACAVRSLSRPNTGLNWR